MQVPKGRENQILSKTEENFKGTKTRMEEQCGRGLAKAIERKSKSPELTSAIHRCLASPRAIGKAH